MSNSENTFLGVLAGTAIGIVLGILIAPDKGANTRQKISDEALKTKQKLSDTVDQIKEKSDASATTQNQNLDEHIESILSTVSYKADEVITALEGKLKDLKEKNKEFQENN